MTNVIFDIVDVAGEVHPGDTVRIWPPRVTRNTEGQTVATRPETINVGAGPVTRDISPGPMWVQIQADGYTDTDPKLVRIPEAGEFPDTPTLAGLLARVEHYDPVLESWAYENAERAEQAALDAINARDRSEAGAELSKDSAAVAVAASVGMEGFVTSAADSAAWADGRAATAVAHSENAVERVTSLEAMAGLSPQSPTDGQTANLLQQPDTLTRSAFDGKLDRAAPPSVLTRGTYTGEAIRDAIVKALMEFPSSGDKNRTVYIPAGDYEIEPGFFSNWDWNAIGLNNHIRSGLRIVGDGKHATRLILQTGGEESWFYDSFTDSRSLFMDLVFEGISFLADDQSKGNGFKQWSRGQDKRFRFINCNMQLNTVLHTLGTGNADLNRFINTHITANGPVLILDNHQSVANGFDGCDITVRKSLVEVRSGGSFWVNNGNIELHNHGDDLSDHYLFDAPSPVGNGQGNAEFNVTDVRFEMHGSNKKLVRSVDSPGMLQFNFTRASFGTVAGGAREVVTVGKGTRVSFRDCILHDNFRFAARTFLNNSPMGALIVFDSCDVGRGNALWPRCVTEGNQARIMAKACFRQVSEVTTLIKRPQDFDFGWNTAPAYAPQPLPKLVSIKNTTQGIPFPGDANSNLRVNLPRGAYITRVFVKKVALAGTSGDYQLHVGPADMSTVLASSEMGSYPQEVVLSATNLGFSDTGELSVWATGSPNHRTTGGAESVAFVEYI